MGAGTPGTWGTHGTVSPPLGPLPRGTRIGLLLSLLAVLLVLVGVAVWAAVDPGRYTSSRDGCVSVTVPSSTGGALLHGCGDQARAMCRAAFAGSDRIALLTRPEGELAGLGPSTGGG